MPHLAAWLVAILLIVVLVCVTLRWFRHHAGKHKSKHPHAMEALSRTSSETGNWR